MKHVMTHHMSLMVANEDIQMCLPFELINIFNIEVTHITNELQI